MAFLLIYFVKFNHTHTPLLAAGLPIKTSNIFVNLILLTLELTDDITSYLSRFEKNIICIYNYKNEFSIQV